MSGTQPEAAASFLRKVRATATNLESVALDDTSQPPVTHFDALPPEHKAAVEGALNKLDQPAAMAPPERFALEAIIIPDHRPAIAIENDDYAVTHRDWLHFNADPVRAMLKPAIPAIGRLELPSRPDIPYAGTAFLVGDGLLMTNRHVGELFVDGVGRGLVFRPGATAKMNFVEEAHRAVATRYPVTSVVLIHPYWDMALLKVEGVAAPPLTLAIDDPADPAEDVAVIGYPAFNPSMSRSVQDAVFDGLYNVKRLQPGRRLRRRAVDSFGKSVNAATHDASTLGGNSGSAVLSPTTGLVVALHFGGTYLDTNYAVPARDLALDSQLVDAGIRFAAPRPAPTQGPWTGWWRGLETTPAAAPPPRSIASTPRQPDAPPPPPPPPSVPARQASITVPLTITVTLGDDGAVVAAAPAAAPVLERVVEPWHADDYQGRSGYDPDFLGIAVPPPEADDPAVLATLADGTTLIPYTHFSIAMHRKRRLALFTASNVSAERALRSPERGRDYTRHALGGLGGSDTEKWFTDPRLRGDEQLPDRFFTRDRNAFDKGHLVRRDDVAWGESYDELRRANGDTFHVTNCSPQVAAFNRPKGTENWGDLEKAVLAQAVDQKLCVFAGPVLADDDPVFRGVDDDSAVAVPIPRAFWKVIVAPDGGGVGVYAFLLDQDLSDVAMEGLDFAASWRGSMVSIADLEARLGFVRFPDVFHDADRTGTGAGAAVAKAMAL